MRAALDQQGEQVECLARDGDFHAVDPELTAVYIECEVVELLSHRLSVSGVGTLYANRRARAPFTLAATTDYDGVGP
jgi:hypothetical protein